MLRVELDEDKAMRLGISTSQVYDTLSTLFAGNYVNDFTRNGRTYRVIIQGNAESRQTPEDFGRAWSQSLFGRDGAARFASKSKPHLRLRFASPHERLSGCPIHRAAVEGVSSGEAIRIVEEIAEEILPEGYGIEWTGQAWHEKRIGALVDGYLFSV